VLPFASPTRQFPEDGHEIAVRLAPAATGIALDQCPAGPLVVDVVECVVVVGAPELEGDELQLAATSATVASATAVSAVRYDATPLRTIA
jgi:hypothetical protein